MNHVLDGGPVLSQRKRQFGGGAFVKYREYPSCGRYSQLYSIEGYSDAAFRCQYCSNFLFVASGQCLFRVSSGELYCTQKMNTPPLKSSEMQLRDLQYNYSKLQA